MKQLKNNWSKAVVFTIILMVVVMALGSIPYLGGVLSGLVGFSIVIAFLAFFRDQKADLIQEAISPYKEDYIRWI
ncbi:MAG: hypothetical protein LBF15_02380 [Candidatus Peribacteria bacterium]|nr:hypothetical protein [Candidatus Peribacteria bacterium]